MSQLRGSHICNRCHSIMIPNTKYSGTFTIELLVWIIALFLTPFTIGFSLAIAFLYTLYRKSKKNEICSECGSEDVIPVHTPSAKKILNELGLVED